MSTQQTLRNTAYVATIVSSSVLVGERIRDTARQRLVDKFNKEQDHIQANISDYAASIELHADDIIAQIASDLLGCVEIILDDEDDDPVEVLPRTLRTYFAIRILRGYIEGVEQYYQRRSKWLLMTDSMEIDFSEVDEDVEKLLFKVDIDEEEVERIVQRIVKVLQ